MLRNIQKNKIFKFLSLSLGVTTSQIALILIGISDSIMMGRQNSVGLAAGTWVASVYNLGLLFCMGMIIPIAILIGRIKNRNSGNEQAKIIAGYCRVVFILSLGVIVFLLAVVRANSLFGKDDMVLEIAEKYAWGIVPGIFPWIMFYLIRNILLCSQRVKMTTLLSMMSVILNIFLNYVFIYGIGKFKGMGALGCSVATSITNWIVCLMALGMMKKNSTVFSCNMKVFFSKSHYGSEIWKLGFPTGLMFFSESLIFAVGNSLLASISTTAVVAFGIAVSWLNLSYMFPVALSQVLTEPLAEYHALGKKKEFVSMSQSSLWVTLIYNLLWIVAIVLFRKWLIYAIVGKNCTTPIFILAEQFLYIMTAIIFAYNFIVVLSGILRGFGDVKTPLLMMIIMYWGIGVGGTILLTQFMGVYGVLFGMLIGFWLTFIGTWGTYRKKILEEFSEAGK